MKGGKSMHRTSGNATSTPRYPGRNRSLAATLAIATVTAGSLVAVATPAHASATQVLINDTFTGATTSAPVMPIGSGLPCLTAGADPSATPIPGCNLQPADAPGSGALRFTNAVNNQASGLLYDTSIPTSQGLTITFDQYQYGGSGADGISFIVAAAPPQPTAIGPFGGHLGYSGGTAGFPTGNGVPNGYLGVGFDVFGNYGRTSFGGTDCAGKDFAGATDSAQPNEVSVRGPGNGTTGYCLLSHSGLLGPSLHGTSRIDAKRAVRITLDPVAGTYTVDMDAAGGTSYTTVTSGSLPTPVPARITFGFAGSTGDVTDVHEITNITASTLNGIVPVLTLAKTDSLGNAAAAPGQGFNYVLSAGVDPSGADETLPASVKITDPLPAGISTTTSPSGSNWDCSASSQTNVSCIYQGIATIARGSTLPPVTVPVAVSTIAPSGPIQNTATVISNDAAGPVNGVDTINVQRALANLTMTTSTPQVPTGRQQTPLANVPQSALTPTLGAVLESPFKFSPFKFSPFKFSPFKFSPFKFSPFKFSPFKFSPVESSQFKLLTSTVTLDQVPLVAPQTWDQVLAGTPLAGVPIQNVTLAQVLALNPPVNLTLNQIDLSATPLRNVTVEAFLLGTTPLGVLPGQPCTALAAQAVNCNTFNPAATSPVDVELLGGDLRSYYDSTPIPFSFLGSANLINSPMTGAHVNDWAFDQSTVGQVPTSALNADMLSCTPSLSDPTCDTLAHAEDNGHVTDTATVGELLALPAASSYALRDLVPAIVAPQQFPVETAGLPTLESLAPLPAPGSPGLASYKIGVDAACSSTQGLTLTPALPPGFRPLPTSVGMRVGEAAVAATLNPTSGAISPVAPISCTGTTHVTATFQAEPGPVLSGPLGSPVGQTSSVTAASSTATVTATGQAPIVVVDGTDEAPLAVTPPAPPATPVQPDTLYLGHLATPGEVDYYSLPAPAKGGSTITVTLSHIPAGQDYDLVVYGPAGSQLRPLDQSAPFKFSPFKFSPFKFSPFKFSPAGDQSQTADGSTTATPTESLQDVPIVKGLTIRADSVQRGNLDESVQFVTLASDTTPFTIQVSGYNGSASANPYVLHVQVSDPPPPLPCQPRSYGTGGTPGTLPATPLPASTQALILVNAKRIGDIYGAAAETQVMTELNKLAAQPADASGGGQPGPMGAVIPVEADPAVAADYAAWDANNCDVAAANQVVTDINSLVDRVRPGLHDLRYVVVAGSDEVVPFGRIPDLGPLANEHGYVGAAFRGADNATSAALRAGYLLSDDPYGDFAPTPWFNGELYVPQVALGRLVETPTDISNAVEEYLSLHGRFTPNAGLTTGYDFMTPAADLVNAALKTQVPTSTEVAPPNDPSWSRSDLLNGNRSATTPIPSLASVANGFLSLNAHYDHYRAESARDFNGSTPDAPLTTADLPANLKDAIMFTMGCHAGLNVADVLVASPSADEAARLADWSQTVSSRGGLLAANTGFGLGDSAVVAYSERLLAYYAQNLNGQMTIGQALLFAKQHYLALGAPSIYDAKALEENVFYGLPMYKLGANGVSAPSVATPPPAPSPSTLTTAVASAGFDATSTGFVLHTDSAGHQWFTVGTELPQTTPHEPVMPLHQLPLPPRTDGLSPHGAFIEQMTSTDQPQITNPLYDNLVVDQNASTTPLSITQAGFPSILDSIDHILTPQGPQDVLTFVPAQFSQQHGERTFTSIQTSVQYSNSDNLAPPTISTVDGVVQGSNASFALTTPDTDVTRAVVLFLAQSGNPLGEAWTHVELSNGGGGRWAGTAAVPANLANQPVGQYFVELLDQAGNVATSSNKGESYIAPPAASASGIQILANGSATIPPFFTGPVGVTVNGTGPFQVSVDKAAPTAYTGAISLTSDGVHTVDVTRTSDGATSNAVIVTDAGGPQITITSPTDGGVYQAGNPLTPAAVCSSPSGIPAGGCVVGAPVVSSGTQTFTVTATDNANKTATLSVTYTEDGTVPQVSILSQPANPTTSTSATFTFSASDADGAADPPATTCSLDGAPPSACGGGGISYGPLSTGTHTFSVTTTDRVGNQATATTQWTILQATSVTLGSSSSPSVVGQSVTYTATVTPAPPGGTVAFSDGTTSIAGCTARPVNASGVATCAVTYSSVGSRTITAAFGGAPGFSPSSSPALTQTVNKDASLTALTISGSTIFGHAVTLTATVTAAPFGAGIPTGSVSFSDGLTTLATVPLTGGQASFATSALAPGSHHITATYSGDANFVASSGQLNEQVICGRTITGTVNGPLTVTGSTCIQGATVNGPVTLNAGSALAVSASKINGPLRSTNALGLQLCASTINGPLSVSGTTGFVLVGDGADDGTPACAGNTINGPATLSNNTAQVEVAGNRINGPLMLMGTSGTGPSAENSVPELEANSINGPLSCGGNAPAPINDGQLNTTNGRRSGQCAKL